MTHNILMRPAVASDADALSELICKNAQSTLAVHYTEKQWEAFFSYYSPEAMIGKIQTQSVFCAVVNEEIIGTIALENDFVLGFYTRVEKLNQGIGTFMMAYLEDFAKKSGISELYLAASPVALDYYYKNGWKKIKDTTIMYRGIPFDETLMKKLLV